MLGVSCALATALNGYNSEDAAEAQHRRRRLWNNADIVHTKVISGGRSIEESNIRAGEVR